MAGAIPAADRRRVMAIDYGARRIGLAISDPGGRMALPFGTVLRADDRSAARRLAAIARREGVGVLVVGMPRRLDGSLGGAAERVERFAARLAKLTGLPVEPVDEALTSVEAEQRLAAAGLDREATAERVDEVAAQILLQEFLDRRPSGARR